MSEIWPCIDSKGTDTFKARKSSENIIKIVHVTSGFQPKFYEAKTSISLIICIF